MRENGLTAHTMERDCKYMSTFSATKVNSRRVSSRVWEWKHGLMAVHLWAIIVLAFVMDLAFRSGPTNNPSPEITATVSSRDSGHTVGTMGVNLLVTGSIKRYTGLVYKITKMGGDMKDFTN